MKRPARPGFVAATVGLALLLSGYLAGRTVLSNRGLHGTYATADKGQVVRTRIDRRVSFDNGVLVRSAFTNHWDIDRLGFPHEFPRYRVSWRGFITVPEDPIDETVSVPGLRRRIYAGPDFRGDLIGEEIVDAVSFTALTEAERPVEGPYSIEWYGQFEVAQAGTHSFLTHSANGSWLYVDHHLVVENGGQHGIRERQGSIDLTAGRHDLRVRFNSIEGPGALMVLWDPPGQETTPGLIPTDALSHAPASRALAIDCSAAVEVRVGASRVLSSPGRQSPYAFSPALEPGRHPIAIDVTDDEPTWAFHFRPGWVGPDGAVHPLPPNALSTTDRPARLRFGLDAIALTLAAAFALSLLTPGGWRIRVREYSVWLWGHRWRVGIVSIVLLAALLRFYQYDAVPLFLETFDEFKTGWIGWTLLNEGTPSGWTHGELGPGTYAETWFGNYFLIAKLKLHPPPLFPIMAGIACLLAGVDQMFEVSLSVIRIPGIVCSLVTTVLVYLLALHCYGRRTAFLASLLFATIPNVVVSARLAKEENLLAALAVGAMLLILRYLDSGKRHHLYLSVLVAALATLTKETGFYLGAVVFLLLARHRKWRDIARTVPLFAAVYGIYFVYCWWYASDPLSVVGEGGELNATGVWTIRRFFSTGRIVDVDFGMGWTVWLSLTLIAGAVRKNWAIVGPLISYLLLMALILGQNFDYGWYRIPLYPFLCIAAAVFVVDMVRESDLFRATVFLLLAVMPSLLFAWQDSFFKSPWSVRWFIAFALLPFALHFFVQNDPSRLLARVSAAVLVAAFVMGNIWIVVWFIPIYVGS